MAERFFEISVEDSLTKLETAKNGLTQDQASKRLALFGPNEFSVNKETTPWQIIVNQFSNFFVLLLLGAAALSWFVGDRIEVAIILIVVAVNVVVGFFQEYKADNALKALRQMLESKVAVIRGGVKMQISHRELVPGDIVVLAAGDKVAADLRLIEVEALRVDEAALTGESQPVSKQIESIKGDVEVPDQINMTFAGTLVVAGRGLAVATDTGQNTQFAKIAKLVSEKEEAAPLEKKLDAIGKWFTIISIAIGAVVFFLSIFRGSGFVEAFTFVIALLVAAVPESLPTIVTLSLALGVVRLARQKSIVRRLPVVETLGDIDVIATDKTGTLTKNEMTVTQLAVVTQKGLVASQVSGAGYDVKGEVAEKKLLKIPMFAKLILAGALCSDADLKDGKPSGDPTEVALLTLAAKAGQDYKNLRLLNRRIDEIPFDPAAKFMATLHQSAAGGILVAKGALEALLAMSQVDEKTKKILIETEAKMAKEGLRVLAIGWKIHQVKKISQPIKDFEIAGLVGMVDPVREGIKESLATLQAAGIATIVITGDHKLTALAVARQLGMAVDQQSVMEGRIVAGLSDDELKKAVGHVKIFARVLPEAKLKIVNALKANGKIVAVTGDGVNDAPALKAAHVGIAMGLRGTDVAKETADLVLLDDSFATIAKSVEFGRAVFDNIRKFITLLLAGNLVEVLVVATAAIIGLPLPFTTVQILWINLTTDSFPALALGFQPPAAGILKDRPNQRNRGIIKLLFSRSLALATVGFIACMAIFLHFIGVDKSLAQTSVFTFIVLFELMIVFPLFRDRPIFTKGPRPTPLLYGAVGLSFALQIVAIYGPFAHFFGTVPLGFESWLWIAAWLLVAFLSAELLNFRKTRIPAN